MKAFFKVLEIVLIVLLLAGVVYGVLYFLRACEASKEPEEPESLGGLYILIAPKTWKAHSGTFFPPLPLTTS